MVVRTQGKRSSETGTMRQMLRSCNEIRLQLLAGDMMTYVTAPGKTSSVG